MRISEIESDNRVMYHVSKSTNRQGILDNGFLVKSKEHTNIKRTPGVYLFSSLDWAIDWAFWFALDEKQNMDIWEVVLPKDYQLKVDRHPEMKKFNAFVGYAPISPEHLRVIKTQPVPKSANEAPPFIK